jgi:hypothetical protein
MPRKQVEIDVTPVSQSGNEVNCSIDPPPGHKKNGHIRLDKGEAYVLRFNLRPGIIPNLQFKPLMGGNCDAFWSDPASCPLISTNAGQYSNPRLQNAKKLEVDVDIEPGGSPSEIHYRLNFDQERSFDPIIIHE